LEEINVLPHFSSITLEDMGEKEDILGGRVWIWEKGYTFTKEDAVEREMSLVNCSFS
jgi:hypothetical protein